MNIELYREKQRQLRENQPQRRKICLNCRQPDFSCYCQHVEPIDTGIKFVILIHPLEFRRRIATGRMAHLCLKDSELILGQDFSNNAQINSLLQNPKYHPVILYPGQRSQNLSIISEPQRKEIFASEKTPLIFVVDGTWNTARRMVRLSQNLSPLPQICFTPTTPSRFRVRQQPKAECLSTIEAIHATLDLLGRGNHDGLLKVFDTLVEQQLAHVKHNHSRHARKIPSRP